MWIHFDCTLVAPLEPLRDIGATRRYTWRHTYDKGAQWLVTLCVPVVHECDTCSTVLASGEIGQIWPEKGPKGSFSAKFVRFSL